MSKRILLVTGDAGECYETLYAYHRFLEARMEPVIAAPSKRLLNLVMHHMEPGWDTYAEHPGYRVAATSNFEEVDVDRFDAILLLGGRAPEFLRHNQRLLEIVHQFDTAGKWLFSICHGIQVLVAAGVVRGRSVTCYEHVRSEVETAGATWCTPQAVRDGRIVTAQTWESHPEFYQLVFACLSGADL